MYKFKLPDIGEGVNEGEIVKWHVKEGDEIKRDQDMVEVMTDKVTVKVPSPVEGKVARIYFEEGKLVEVGTVLIDILAAGEEAPPEPSHEVEKEVPPVTEEVRKPEPRVEETEEEIVAGHALASPAVRRIARERGIRLSDLRGSGPNGRVTLEDLEGEVEPAAEHVAEVKEEIQEEVIAEAPEQPAAEEPVPSVEPSAEPEGDIIVPKGLRRLIFEKMTKSKQIIPHFTIIEEVYVGPIKDSIKRLKDDNITVTFTPFFVKACAIALRDFPYLNSIYDHENRRYHLKKRYNMGIAIDTPDGLTVAVVKDTQDKSLIKISGEIYDLATRARENNLKLEEVQDSTFTVSNVGSIAGIMSTPIINYPEVAILGVHRTITELDQDGKKRDKMYISLSCDHRLIDGAYAARFVRRLKNLLEDPILILSQ